jgi:hypothetical protein
LVGAASAGIPKSKPWSQAEARRREIARLSKRSIAATLTLSNGRDRHRDTDGVHAMS